MPFWSSWLFEEVNVSGFGRASMNGNFKVTERFSNP